MCRQVPPTPIVSRQSTIVSVTIFFWHQVDHADGCLRVRSEGRAQLDQTMRVKQRKENKNVCLQIKAPRWGSNLKESSVPLSFCLSAALLLSHVCIWRPEVGISCLPQSVPTLFLSFFLMLCVCVSVCHVSPGPLGGQKRVLDTWNWLSRLLVVICLWLLGTELRPSRRRGSMPNCWAIFPVPLPYLLRQDLFLSLIPELMDFTRLPRELQRSA